MVEERWLPVAVEGFEIAYEISDHGRLRTKGREMVRKNGVKYLVPERIIRHGFHPFGYPIVCLKCNGKKKMMRVHRLVALSFVPNPIALPSINHKDSDPKNNHYSNLEWCDAKYNINYSVNSGRMKKKLTWDIVMLIRQQLKNGDRGAEIARRFGVSRTTISYIKKNAIWKI